MLLGRGVDYNDKALTAMFAHAYGISHVKDSEVDGKKLFRVDMARIFAIAKAAGKPSRRVTHERVVQSMTNRSLEGLVQDPALTYPVELVELGLELRDAPAKLLARQLLDFLEARSMTLVQVGKYMPEGLRALSNLMNMLFEAASACKVSVKKGAGWDYIGLKLDGSKYWVGVTFAEPEKLWFSTSSKIDPEAARKLGVGDLGEENWVPGRFRWHRGIELDSEPVHFFSRSKVSQMQWLEGFVKECLALARKIETPEQPPIPEEPEEGN
jgi:hypothetical protein